MKNKKNCKAFISKSKYKLKNKKLANKRLIFYCCFVVQPDVCVYNMGGKK